MGENTWLALMDTLQVGEVPDRNRSGFEINNHFGNGFTLLSSSIRTGNLESTRLLVGKGASVNQCESIGATPLLLAAHLDRLDVVECLVNQGASMNTSDSYETPLMVATRKGHLKIAKYLVERGASINAVDINGISPLFWAINNNKVKTLEVLLIKGIPKTVGESPLMVATKNGFIGIIQCLLKHGADSSEAPLTWAAKKGQLEVIKTLISNGSNINRLGEDGNTALATAVRHKQTEVVRYLLSENANICKVGRRGKPPLLWAILNKDPEMVRWILDQGSAYIIDTVFLEAIATKNLEIVALLHQRGAFKDTFEMNGTTPLEQALSVESLDIAKYLLENGSVLVRDLHKNEITHLVKFLEKKNYAFVDLLIEKGARLETYSKCGCTALTKSVMLEDFDMVRKFIQNGALVNKADRKGLVPLVAAVGNNDFRIFQYLVDCGATIDGLRVETAVSRYYQIARDDFERRKALLNELQSNQEGATSDQSDEELIITDEMDGTEVTKELTLKQRNYYVIEFD